MLATTPELWQVPLGNTADSNTIPTDKENEGQASIADLFPSETSLDIKDGGIAPTRKDVNGLFKLLGDNIFFMQHGGVYSYSVDTDYDYSALVTSSDHHLYFSLNQNGPNTPNGVHTLTDTDYWTDLTVTTVPNATVNSAGVVQLSNQPSDSQTEAVTPYALKQLQEQMNSYVDGRIEEVDSNATITHGIEGIYGIEYNPDTDEETDVPSGMFNGMVIQYNNKLYMANQDIEEISASDWVNYYPDTHPEYWTQIPEISSGYNESFDTQTDNIIYSSIGSVKQVYQYASGVNSNLQNTIRNLENLQDKLNGILDSLGGLIQATTETVGGVELATQDEVTTGTDTVRVVTPATLKSVTNGLEQKIEAKVQQITDISQAGTDDNVLYIVTD